MEAKYLLDCYTKDFESKVKRLISPTEIILEETYFYPTGGGQPNDEGIMRVNGKEYNVIDVKKSEEGIIHVVDKEGIQAESRVKGEINWKRRYKHMRSHTAAHIICDIISNETGALVTGNQITTEKVRIDFALEDYDAQTMSQYIDMGNDVIRKELPVLLRMVSREEAQKELGNKWSTLAKGFPEEIKEIRIVDIEGFEKEACGGTHVANVKEIGLLEFIKVKSKGKNNRRIEFNLAN